jgi:hypothetical protein
MAETQATAELIGFYYLHQNGSLIFKPNMPGIEADFRESDLVRKWWPVRKEDRASAWILCTEALALGARKERVAELAKKWGLDDDDASYFFVHMQGEIGAFRDGDQWCAHFKEFTNILESQVGFGPTILEALAELARPGLTVSASSEEPTP